MADPSTIVNEVSVPKVIPMKTTFGQKMSIAKKRADKIRRERKRKQELYNKHIRGSAGSEGGIRG